MQIQCPKCNSFKTMTDRKQVLMLGGIMVFFGFLFSFLIFPLFFAAIGALLLVSGAFTKAKKVTCMNCKYKWQL